jgi:hypothetical protein
MLQQAVGTPFPPGLRGPTRDLAAPEPQEPMQLHVVRPINPENPI